MTRIEFVEALQKIGITINQKQENQFYEYAALLKEWNEKMNLTGISEEPEVLEMHFYDSILPLARLHITEGSFADVGAGAGFPSLPCKIANPNLKVTIIEPLQKRCVFLNEVVKQLKLEDVEIVNARAEDFASTHREFYDIVSARAVSNLNILSELCLPLVKKNGLFLAMKGSSGLEEKEAASKAISILGGKYEQAFEEKVGEHTHINLIYRKSKETPTKYPRAYAKIKKSPL